MTWQIPKGASSVPISLFEEVTHLDAGSIYLQQKIAPERHESVDE